jgi:hypothetical protein
MEYCLVWHDAENDVKRVLGPMPEDQAFDWRNRIWDTAGSRHRPSIEIIQHEVDIDAVLR